MRAPSARGGYVTRKIARAAAEIAAGQANEVVLGNLEARRDWGFAGDYVEAMYLMMQADTSDDYVVATGESHSVREFCEEAFAHVGLDYRDCVRQDRDLFRPVDISETRGDAGKARGRLGWEPKATFCELVHMMVDKEIERIGTASSPQ
jgi:GDPmannose 4,6-dehydratase